MTPSPATPRPGELLKMSSSLARHFVKPARLLTAFFGCSALAPAETVHLYFDSAAPQIAFAAADIKAALEKQKHAVESHVLADLANSGPRKKIVLSVATNKTVASMLSAQGGKPAAVLGTQAYSVRTTTQPDLSYWVLGGDANGAMYGGFEVAEKIAFDNLGGGIDMEGSKSNPEICAAIYAPLRDVPNATFQFSVKYAMAHMYSTPTPKWGGDISSVNKLGMKTWLTFRNDDYFYLNWGDPAFVRDFMAGIPLKDSVVGMYIGIDGYNPSRTCFYKNESLNGRLEVERRWYMEMLWGRIFYNSSTSDEVFKKLLAGRYPALPAGDLFEAWSLASRSLPKVTELVMGEWKLDFHWYPEGCWSDPGRCTGFRTIDGFANDTTVAKGSNLCDIATSAKGDCQGRKSSYEVADEMQADAERALDLINPMESGGNADVEVAINNVKQLAYLSAYYAHKVRGATFKKAGKTVKAREEMGLAYGRWMEYSRSMERTYHPDSFRNLEIAPDWKFADAAVLKEYTDLGGTGIPDGGTTRPRR